MIILELLVGGFFSALGWWSANHYVVEPYLEPKTKVEKQDDGEHTTIRKTQ